MALSIAIVDYGMGNLHSVFKKVYQLKADPVIVSTSNEILRADKIILPGVGHFGKAIGNLRQLGLYDALNEAVLQKKIPILGICLGMQLMAKESEEGNVTGFGWIDARVVRFKIKDKIKHKVPQTGWNSINFRKESALFKNLVDDSEFYFLHSYHYDETDQKSILATTEFEYEFVSAIEKENIYATQFHPEKSHNAGAQLLRNFIQL